MQTENQQQHSVFDPCFIKSARLLRRLADGIVEKKIPELFNKPTPGGDIEGIKYTVSSMLTPKPEFREPFQKHARELVRLAAQEVVASGDYPTVGKCYSDILGAMQERTVNLERVRPFALALQRVTASALSPAEESRSVS